jgi:hypothetical protein
MDATAVAAKSATTMTSTAMTAAASAAGAGCADSRRHQHQGHADRQQCSLHERISLHAPPPLHDTALVFSLTPHASDGAPSRSMAWRLSCGRLQSHFARSYAKNIPRSCKSQFVSIRYTDGQYRAGAPAVGAVKSVRPVLRTRYGRDPFVASFHPTAQIEGTVAADLAIGLVCVPITVCVSLIASGVRRCASKIAVRIPPLFRVAGEEVKLDTPTTPFRI